jgi:hypothetical protein
MARRTQPPSPPFLCSHSALSRFRRSLRPTRGAGGLVASRQVCRPLALALAGLTLVLSGLAARAQSPSPNQPLAIDGLPPPPCPLLVPASDYALQPLRIQPSQVARKNAVGCLSPADAALYGPDGCPVKLCHPPQGTVPLPQL